MPIFGDYETFGEPIAITEDRGHVSTVWRARKIGKQGDPNFAVKCYAPHRRKTSSGGAEDALDKDPAQEFLAGIKQLQKACNEDARSLVPIHDLGFADEGAWYVTNYYSRNTLKAWIARRGGVDSAALRQVVRCVVSGCLSLKHSRGFAHGNLKAANVFLVGKPRPLRSTPLHLADAYPAAPLQLARLGRDDRRTVDELLHQVIEVHDLRALGEILLQLVEGRIVTNAYDYNYPIASSPAWENLGRDSERWRDLCNRLLDPQLSPDKLSLESLAKEYGAGGVTQHLPKILAGAGALCLIAASVYLGLHFMNQGREARLKAEAEKVALLISDSKTALKQNDFSTAISKLEEALSLKPDSTEASALKAEAAEAEKKRKEAQTQAEQDQNYRQAIDSGRAAYQKADYVNAVKQAEIALGYRARDGVALKLKADAEAGQKNKEEQTKLDENYKKAMAAGQAALTSNDYPLAIKQADLALGFRAGDAAANALKTEAEKKRKEAQTQAENAKAYQTAMEAATNEMTQADLAFKGFKYDVALGQYDEALKECGKAERLNIGQGWKALVELLGHRKADVQMQSDYSLAYTNYDKGQYQAALDACAKYQTENFTELKNRVDAEKRVYDAATNDFNKGNYAFLKNSDVAKYRESKPFKKLLEDASLQIRELNQLAELKKGTNWSDLLTEWKKLGNAAYLKNDSFIALKSWADIEKGNYDRKITAYLEQLDREVEVYLVKFNLLKASKAKFPEAKGAEVYGEIDYEKDKKPILERLKALRREYEGRVSLTSERKSNLDKLEKIIPNYP